MDKTSNPFPNPPNPQFPTKGKASFTIGSSMRYSFQIANSTNVKSKAMWQKVNGILKKGHQVASGMATDSPYPKGTIEMQTPYFQDLGLDLTPYFPGTLNISIHPHSFKLIKPEYTFRNLQWNQAYPAEDFSFSRCRVVFAGNVYPGLVYYPHPETKIGHFQDPSTVEVIAVNIPEISYGDALELELNSQEIEKV